MLLAPDGLRVQRVAGKDFGESVGRVSEVGTFEPGLGSLFAGKVSDVSYQSE